MRINSIYTKHFTKQLIICLVMVLSSFNGNAQECAKITIYRPNVLSNSLYNFAIYVNDIQVGIIPNNAMMELNLKYGASYEISSKYGMRGEMYRDNSTLVVSVECGNNYYVKIKSGAFEAASLLNLTHESMAGEEISNIPISNLQKINYEGEGIEMANNTIHQPQEKDNIPPQPPPRQTRTTNTGSISNTQPTVRLNTRGKSYALIIGVNDYQDYSMNDLDQPVADAQKLHDVLVKKYSFNSSTVTFLKNPTKNEITSTLDKLYEKLHKEDNLLIFYAGHGYWDERFQQGYWLASDATRDNRGTWLSNGTIRDYIRAIPAKHTLLITDACFGGGIFKSRAAFANSSTAINQLYSLPSRKAMTSGAMSEVPDKSVFIHYLVKRLEENDQLYLSSEQLFASFKIAVINNSANGQVPQYGEVRETGDEGGDYIFVLKN